MTQKVNTPTILVVLGATGDLMSKKITPALFHLFENNQLPKLFQLVGVSRDNLSPEGFKDKITEILKKRHGNKIAKLDDFLNTCAYQQGFFENRADYQKISKAIKEIDDRWGVCANKLFYLAVPPQNYKMIFENLASSGLTKPCSPKEGWTRVIVEKPFGKDLKTAQELDNLLSKLFREEQIYRIDHYLGKEMIQNIMAFRFSNNLLENQWNNQLIESINLRLLETIGVEDRGAFYDGVGALRDVGQNHFLQMLAFVTMDHPRSYRADNIRKNRAKILKTLEIPKEKDIESSTFRAQYDGYRQIDGVAPKSQTETYFKIKTFLKAPQWKGVPIVLEGGKRIGHAPLKEIEIIFKHPTPCLCMSISPEHQKNRLTIHLEPKEGISIEFWSKKPGLKLDLEKRSFEFQFRDSGKKNQYTEEYEKLLLDCIAGDQTLFVSSDEVKAMWAFIDPIVCAWQKNLTPLKSYKPDTDDIRKELEFVKGADNSIKKLKKEIGVVGLGKMGRSIKERLEERGWRVIGYDKDFSGEASSLQELIKKLSVPRLVWLMAPHKAVGAILKELTPLLTKGDIIVDGGNSFYEDSIKRAKELAGKGISFMDVGVSGGPEGARNGASLMIGGEKKLFEDLEPLFGNLSVSGGYSRVGEAGAGHFVKMVHNGIEYGMMQAIAEGFAVMKKSKFSLNLDKIAGIYNHGSVIESKLIGWLKSGFEECGEELKSVSGSVAHSGEGEWTIKTAKKLKVPVKIIEESLKFRIKSQKTPSYVGKILSALRNQFGGHGIN